MRKNHTVIHYYNEIIRYWSKINFIIVKTLRKSHSYDHIDLPKYLYATYGILWEHATEKELINELKEIDKDFLKRVKTFSWKKALVNKNEKEKVSIFEAVPSFILDHLLPVMNMDILLKNIQFMNGTNPPAEITLRVNTLCGEYPEDLITNIKEDFKKNKINYRKDNNVPYLFWIPSTQKSTLIRSSFYQNRCLILQDKASLAVVQTLNPKEKEKIFDMCAAPGLKTSLIAQYQNNKGTIIAGEFLPERVVSMRNLLEQLKILNVHIVNTDSIDFPLRYQNYFDKILLDAPCTGSGTFLTNPELKWRQNKQFLHQNTILQEKLLKSTIDLLKPSGILVYSTCSLYPEEGEYQIKKVVNKLEPMNLPDWMDKSYEINGSFIPGTARLFPAKHHTEGFFIAKFKKK